MKQTIVIICLAIAVASCNNAATSTSGKDSTVTVPMNAPNLALPFKLDEPYKNWQIGSKENAVAAMNALKAFVDKDFTKFASLTGDRAQLN